MKTSSQFLIFVFFIFHMVSIVNGQVALVASGGNTEGTAGTVSYTIGQTAFKYYEETNGSVSQGVQQPYEIFLLTGIEKASGISLDCMVYPNPVQHHLQLNIQGLESEKFRWGIYDLLGKLIKEDRISGSLSTIPLNELGSGTYLFSVTDATNSTIKTFKIIKN